ncbi:MAG: Na/Pi cotransporter family protein, partial [Oscillospiraceae bacterium]|nr:Na/Pi cotransporter family protein [Oscillospiraceae bacterium]
AIIGAVLFVFLKNTKLRNVGQTLLGFGILFAGMFAMEGAVSGLANLPAFKEMFATLQNPLLGVLAGALVTGVIQSSAASIGILQALTSTGAITWATAIPIILGQNIGTCVTPMIASVGASKGAKRSAFAHLYFNIIGTCVFLGVLYGGAALFAPGGAFFGDNPLSSFFGVWGQPITRGDIANFHTLFNVLVTLLFLPFTKVLARLAEWTIRDKSGETDAVADVPVLDERLLQSPAVALQQTRSAVEAMATRSRANFTHAVDLLFEYDADRISTIVETEDTIDRLEVGVTNYLVRLTDKELSEHESHSVSELLYFVTEFERIGDYVINVVDRSGEVHDKGIVFSDTAKSELHVLDSAIGETLDLTIRAFIYDDAATARQVEPLEETIDGICEALRARHITRLKKNQCNIESGIVFLELLTNLERISDHCSNVAARIIGNEYTDEDFDAHALRRDMHNGRYDNYNHLLEQYQNKYLSLIEMPGT